MSVRVYVCPYVCPYVTLFYIFAKCTLVTSSCISCRITQPCGLVLVEVGNTGCRKKTMQSEKCKQDAGKWLVRLNILGLTCWYDCKVSVKIWLQIMHWVKNYRSMYKKDEKVKWTTISLFDVNFWYNDGSGGPPSVGTEESAEKV